MFIRESCLNMYAQQCISVGNSLEKEERVPLEYSHENVNKYLIKYETEKEVIEVHDAFRLWKHSKMKEWNW